MAETSGSSNSQGEETSDGALNQLARGIGDIVGTGQAGVEKAKDAVETAQIVNEKTGGAVTPLSPLPVVVTNLPAEDAGTAVQPDGTETAVQSGSTNDAFHTALTGIQPGDVPSVVQSATERADAETIEILKKEVETLEEQKATIPETPAIEQHDPTLGVYEPKPLSPKYHDALAAVGETLDTATGLDSSKPDRGEPTELPTLGSTQDVITGTQEDLKPSLAEDRAKGEDVVAKMPDLPPSLKDLLARSAISEEPVTPEIAAQNIEENGVLREVTPGWRERLAGWLEKGIEGQPKSAYNVTSRAVISLLRGNITIPEIAPETTEGEIPESEGYKRNVSATTKQIFALAADEFQTAAKVTDDALDRVGEDINRVAKRANQAGATVDDTVDRVGDKVVVAAQKVLRAISRTPEDVPLPTSGELDALVEAEGVEPVPVIDIPKGFDMKSGADVVEEAPSGIAETPEQEAPTLSEIIRQTNYVEIPTQDDGVVALDHPNGLLHASVTLSKGDQYIWLFVRAADGPGTQFTEKLNRQIPLLVDDKNSASKRLLEAAYDMSAADRGESTDGTAPYENLTREEKAILAAAIERHGSTRGTPEDAVPAAIETPEPTPAVESAEENEAVVTSPDGLSQASVKRDPTRGLVVTVQKRETSEGDFIVQLQATYEKLDPKVLIQQIDAVDVDEGKYNNFSSMIPQDRAMLREALDSFIKSEKEGTPPTSTATEPQGKPFKKVAVSEADTRPAGLPEEDIAVPTPAVEPELAPEPEPATPEEELAIPEPEVEPPPEEPPAAPTAETPMATPEVAVTAPEATAESPELATLRQMEERLDRIEERLGRIETLLNQIIEQRQAATPPVPDLAPGAAPQGGEETPADKIPEKSPEEDRIELGAEVEETPEDEAATEVPEDETTQQLKELLEQLQQIREELDRIRLEINELRTMIEEGGTAPEGSPVPPPAGPGTLPVGDDEGGETALGESEAGGVEQRDSELGPEDTSEELQNTIADLADLRREVDDLLDQIEDGGRQGEDITALQERLGDLEEQVNNMMDRIEELAARPAGAEDGANAADAAESQEQQAEDNSPTAERLLEEKEEIDKSNKIRNLKIIAGITGVGIGAGIVLLTATPALAIAAVGGGAAIGAKIVGKGFARFFGQPALDRLATERGLSEEKRDEIAARYRRVQNFARVLDITSIGFTGVAAGAIVGGAVESVFGPMSIGGGGGGPLPPGGDGGISGSASAGVGSGTPVPSGGLDSLIHGNGNYVDFSSIPGWETLVQNRGWRGLIDVVIHGPGKYAQAQGAATEALNAFMHTEGLSTTALAGSNKALAFHKMISFLLKGTAKTGAQALQMSGITNLLVPIP